MNISIIFVGFGLGFFFGLEMLEVFGTVLRDVARIEQPANEVRVETTNTANLVTNCLH